ncbi:anti-sigma factor [Erythrobacter sp. SDW2]|uniref:anti-sigma factor n=1 Tax=Erythrobacter sp. SDW2 TaxID=2907154 RepID=UPI001F2E216B|nr:anti-sigma factor [Erythrobacter sp. SDW2]UIP06638.1 anti-sigma factor [Erythrobacter sp. SDW2]
MANPLDLPEDEFLLAGELALGALEGEELGAAQRRVLADPAFAAALGWWEERLARMAEAGGTLAPSPDLLRGIHAAIDRLPGNAAPVQLDGARSRRFSRWSIGLAAFGTSMAAAALALYLATPSAIENVTPPGQSAAAPQLVVQLQDAEAGRRLTGVVQPAARRLAISTEGLVAGPGQIAELWVIPADGVPRSLGEIPGSGSFARRLSEAELDWIAAGAALAVTFERDENIRHQTPTAPILLAGALAEV